MNGLAAATKDGEACHDATTRSILQLLFLPVQLYRVLVDKKAMDIPCTSSKADHASGDYGLRHKDATRLASPGGCNAGN